VALPVKTPGEGSRIYTTTWDANQHSATLSNPLNTVQQLTEQRNRSVVDDVGFNGADNVEENPLSERIRNKDRFL
jgi:hypothetical protein